MTGGPQGWCAQCGAFGKGQMTRGKWVCESCQPPILPRPKFDPEAARARAADAAVSPLRSNSPRR